MQAVSVGPSRDELGSGWGWFVLLGVVLAFLGLVAIWNAVDATLVTTVFVGFALLIGGFVEIIGAFTRGSSLGSRVLHIILGILYVIVGFDLIADPLAGRSRSRSWSASCS